MVIVLTLGWFFIEAKIKTILGNVITEFISISQENLTGIYLYGSAAMNCFNPNKSDLDLIVVVESAIIQRDIHRLKNLLLEFDEKYSPVSIEMSVVLKKYIEQLEYPTPFLFHYSKYHRDNCRNIENFSVCNGADYDLVAHFQMIKERGICIFGKSIESYFPEVPRNYFIDSINRDRDITIEEMIANPDYFVLNECRFLMYLREGKFGSKLEGGKWALENMEVEMHEVISKAMKLYSGECTGVHFEKGEMQLFENLMDCKIVRHLSV